MTDDTVKEKQGLREHLADLEDELRNVRDQVSEVEIENHSYGTLADVERQVREARGAAEVQAARASKADLEDNIRRLHSDIKQGEKNREGVQRMINDLKAKYAQAQRDFDSYVKEAQDNKDQLATDLEDLKDRIKT